MSKLKYPVMNSFIISSITFIYGFIFIFTSKQNLLVSSNAWGDFIKDGNMKVIGIIMIAIAAVFEAIVIRQKNFDEYQVNRIKQSIFLNGILSFYLLPVSVVLVVLYPEKAIEIMFAFLIVLWTITILINMILLIIRYISKGRKLYEV